MPVLVHDEGAQPRRVVDRRPPGGIEPQLDVEVDPALLDEGASPRPGARTTGIVDLEGVPGGDDTLRAGGPEPALGDRQIGAQLRRQPARVGGGGRHHRDRGHGVRGAGSRDGGEGERAQQGAPDQGGCGRHGARSWGPHRACCRRHRRILPVPQETDPGVPTPMAVDTQQFQEKTEDQKAMTEMVRQFADEQILPNAEHYDHEDEFPEPIVEQMKRARAVRRDHPRGVRRARAGPDDLRDDRRGALARLDLDLGRSSTPTSSAPTC